MSTFDLPGALRRIRRIADLSQRELAAAAGMSPSAIGHAETGTRDLSVRSIARLATVAGLRLALVDESGDEVEPMSPAAVRDRADRRFPAHLDTRHGDDGWWHDWHRNGERTFSSVGLVVPCGLWQMEQFSCTGWCVRTNGPRFSMWQV